VASTVDGSEDIPGLILTLQATAKDRWLGTQFSQVVPV